MKKSSKIMIGAIVLAFVWTFAYGWLASGVINGALAGKVPGYAHPVTMKATNAVPPKADSTCKVK